MPSPQVVDKRSERVVGAMATVANRHSEVEGEQKYKTQSEARADPRRWEALNKTGKKDEQGKDQEVLQKYLLDS